VSRSLAAALEAASRLAARATIVLIVVLAVAMVGSLLLQVVFRFGIGRALSWSDEVALLSFLWVTLLTGSLGVREGFHVRLTLLVDLLPASWRKATERLVLLSTAGFGVLLLVTGWEYVAITAGSVSPATGYPIELLHLAAPVAGALIVLHAAVHLLAPTKQA